MTSRTLVMTRWRFTLNSYTIRVNTNGTIENLNFAPVANRDYFPTGQNEADSALGTGDAIGRLLACLNSNTAGGVYAATVNEIGRITITCSISFQIMWDDVATTLDPQWFGFAFDTLPVVPAITVTATMTLRGVWVPDQGVFRTNWGERQVVGVSEVAINDTILGFSLSNGHVFWKCVWIFIHQNFARNYNAALAGDPGNCIENLFHEMQMHTFCRFRIYLDWVLNRDATFERNPTLRLANQTQPWEVEEDQRLTSYRVTLEGLLVP